MSIEKMERIWDPATAIEEIKKGHGIVSFEKRAVIAAAPEGDEDGAPIIGAIASARKAGWNEVIDEVTGLGSAWYREKPAMPYDEERILLSLEKIAYELEGIRQLGASSR